MAWPLLLLAQRAEVVDKGVFAAAVVFSHSTGGAGSTLVPVA